MKNLSLKERLNQSPVTLLWALCLSVASSASFAEDIEIYEGLTGEVTDSTVTSEQKPNILFVLDTSGSMGRPEVVLGARPPYDSTVDYGDAGIDDSIYVYDESRVFTGMSVPAEDNLCQSANNFYAENPQFPEYVDRALVWQYIEAQSDTVETCVDDVVETHTDTSTNQRQWNTIKLFDVTPGDEISVDWQIQANGYVAYYFWDEDNDKINNENYCYQSLGNYGSLSCPKVIVPSDAVKLRTRYYRNGSRSRYGDNVTVDLTVHGACTTDTISIPESGDWVLDAADDSEIVALECELDNGIHGRNESATGVYPRYQANASNPANPKYTRSAGNRNAVDWNASALQERLLVPGNYHDYLQSPVSELLGSDEISVQIAGNDQQDVIDYCLAEGDIVQLGGSNTQTYLHGGHYVEHDGSIYECQTRIGALKDATTNIISSMRGANVGLMRFNSGDGGSMIAAMSDVDGSVSITDASTGVETVVANKTKLIQEVLRLPGAGATPLQETLYEAYLYFAGLAPGSAGASKNITNDPNSTIDFPTDLDGTTADITDPDALENGLYKSPMLNQCQDNNIILFSDGSATSDVGRESDIERISGKTCRNDVNGDCLDELAYALANTDVNANIKLDNHVYLHTIGFGSDLTGSTQLLNASNEALRPGAEEGDQHYEATNTDELVNAFQTILLSIENIEADSFIAPAVAVNAFNRLQYREDLYFALFEPTNTPRWNGNLKKYQVRADGQIVDKNGSVAVDDSGFFHSNATSFWSDIVDGNDVSLGGVARQLDIDPPRKLFANLDGTVSDVYLLTRDNILDHLLDVRISSVTDIGSTDGLLQNLLDTNEWDLLNSATDRLGELLGRDFQSVPENTANIIKWTLGEDVERELDGTDTDPNFYLGESLHGTPYVLDFGDISEGTILDEDGNPVPLTDSDGNPILDSDGNAVYETGPVQRSEDILFATTNQGLLHAISGDTGEELFAYVPGPELFANMGSYFNNVIGADHTYGLDGEIEFDVERDPETRAITKAQLFIGQRRGGSKYYAVDVTNANLADPNELPIKKLWTIDNLPQMGQSWARPVATTIKYCVSEDDCSLRDVLVISGGYDLRYDDYDPTVSSSTWLSDLAGTVNGNSIYIVARDTGALLWSASDSEDHVDTSKGYSIFPDMTHSFPAEPTVVDADFDGVADLLFAVDIAGRVWRIDFRGDVTTDDEGLVLIDDSDIHLGNNAAGFDTTTTASPSESESGTASAGGLRDEVSGGIIADLSESGVNRMFFNKLDVSVSPRTDSDKARYNIVTGSGYRAHPLTDEGINNRLYFLFDRNIQFPKFVDEDGDNQPDAVSYDYVSEEFSGGTVYHSRIYADTLSEKDNTVTLDTSTTHRNGFYINLETGTKEKMINPTLTDEGMVIAVSYSPTSVVTNAAGDVCEKNIGSSSLYQIDLYSGQAARLDLAKAGISTKPIVIEVADDDPNNEGGTVKVLIIGSESFDGSRDLVTQDGDIDKLVTPGLNDSNLGKVIKVNWWERRE